MIRPLDDRTADNEAADSPRSRRMELASDSPVALRRELEQFESRAQRVVRRGLLYRMTYRVLGEGPTLILCPGIASTYRVYAILLNRLARSFRTVVFDYPGEQEGDEADLGRITHDDLVANIVQLAEELDAGAVSLLGLSFGSTVALGATRQRPDLFPRNVLQGAFARREFSAIERAALGVGRLFPGRVGILPFRKTALAARTGKGFPAQLPDRWEFYVEQNALTPIGPLASRLNLLARLDLRPALPEIQAELLLLHGEDDRIVHPAHYRELIAGLPRASGVLAPSLGHVPHLTHTESFAGLITGFLLREDKADLTT